MRAAGVAPFVWRYIDITTSEPIRSRSLDAVLEARTAGRASLYVDDTLLLARLIERAPHIRLRAERWRAARPGLAVGATALAGYAAIWAYDVSPAKTIASAMPEKARIALGDSIIRTMPASRRCTGAAGYAALGKLTVRLMPRGPVTAENIVVLDIQTASGKPLINAFAVPGRKLVLTRGIIEQAQSADEIAAVIGHEAGHVIELHPEAGLVRSVGFWALVQMVFTGTPGAISNVGVLLAQLGYTRDAERAADGHALRLLREAGISPKGMADFFRRTATRGTQPSTAPKVRRAAVTSDIFSSHPSNPERIARIEREPAYPSTSALADEDWKKLQSICLNDVPGPAPGKRQPPQPEVAAAAATATAAAAAASKAEAVRIEAAKLAEAKEIAANKAAAERRAVDAKAAANAKAVADAKAAADASAAAERLEAAHTAAAKAAAVRSEAEKAAAAKAEAARAAMEAKQRLALATGIPAPLALGKPGPTSYDVRIVNASARIAANGSDVAALFERGQAYAGKAELASAIGDFTHVLALRPIDANTFFWRASVYARLNELELAVADYNEVVRLQPQNFAAYNNRGSLYKAQKKLDLALRDYSTALAIDGKQAITLTNRAMVYRERHNFDLALADLNSAIAINPNYINAYVRRGETFELKSERDAAIADYRTAIKLPNRGGAGAEPYQTARARLAALGVNF